MKMSWLSCTTETELMDFVELTLQLLQGSVYKAHVLVRVVEELVSDVGHTEGFCWWRLVVSFKLSTRIIHFRA